MQNVRRKHNFMIYMKKSYIFLFSIFIMIFLSFQVYAEGNESSNPAISRFEIYTMNEKTDFLSGEEVNLYAGLSLTETSGVIRNTTLEIKVPKENIIPSSFVASDINSQVSKVMEEDDNYYIVKYLLTPIAAGASLDIPIKFKTQNGYTPNGFEIPVTANFYDENQNTIIDPVTEKYAIVTSSPTAVKYVKTDSGSFTQYDNYVISAGKEDESKPGYLSGVINDLNSVVFSYYLNRPSSTVGVRYYESYIFEDVLPEGAVFIAADNPGWTYDEESRIVRYEYTPTYNTTTGSISFTSNVVLNLKFPGVKANENLTNNVSIEAKPLNKKSYEPTVKVSDAINFKVKGTVKSSVPTTFTVSKSSGRTYYDMQSHKSSETSWSVYIRNLADTKDYPDMMLENVIIEDKNLDSNLKYTGVQFGARNTNIFVGSVDVIVTYNNGETETVAEDLALNTTKTINFSENVKSFSVKFTEGSYLLPGQYFYMYPLTKFVSPETKILAENETTKYLYNSAEFSGNYTDGNTIKGTSNGYVYLRKYDPVINTYKYLINSTESYFINDKVDYRLYVGYTGLEKGDPIKTNKMVDILPSGFEYVPGSSRIQFNGTQIQTDMTNGSLEPQVVANFEGSGQTALVWNLKSFTSTLDIYEYSRTAFDIYYSTKITNLASQGKNTNTAYLSWENNDLIRAGNSSKDVYDLNGNGSMDDLINRATATINYIPPRELIVKKEVKGSLDNKFVLPPGEGLSEIGDSVEYKLTLFNNSVSDYKTMYLVDLMPNLNDKTTSIDQSLDDPSRVNRNSTFKLNLDGEITPPAGFSVYYTTSKITDDIPEFTKNANWVNSLEDYSKATAFKLELSEGNIFKSGEERAFTVSFNVPKDYSLSKKDKAVNSFGVAVTNGLSFVESNMSTVGLLKYAVDGYVFDDFDVDGEYDSKVDKPFKNYLVQLIDDENQVVKDLDGNPYQARTDKNGYYSMDVYRHGEYKIKVLTPEGYQLTQTSEGEFKSHISDGDLGFTSKFDLNYQNEKERKNAGYFREKAVLSFEKELLNSLGEPLENDDLFDFIVKVDNQLYNGKALIDNEEVEIINGEIAIKGGSKVVIEDVDKNTSYNIEEINNEKYIVTPSQSMYEGDLDQSFINHVFINKYVIPTVDITVNKKWVSAPDKKPDIQIQLYRDDKAYGNPVVLKNGKNKYTWKNLDETDENGNVYKYSVDEIDVPKGYKKEVKDFVITNTYTINDKDDSPGPKPLPDTGQTVLFGAGILLVISASGIVFRKYLK